MEFLRLKNIPTLPWPGNSPDLNPIENCWNYMKSNLDGAYTASLPYLKKEIQNMWVHDMDPAYFRALSDSMPKRIQLVIKMKGGMTKY